jgi:hypothetical protein
MVCRSSDVSVSVHATKKVLTYIRLFKLMHAYTKQLLLNMDLNSLAIRVKIVGVIY